MADSDQRESIDELIGQLADDARGYASAELGYYRELANAAITQVRDAALLGSIALMFALAALVALAVGAVMVLAPLVGALMATLIVAGVSLLVAGLCGWLAWRKVTAIVERDQ